MKKIVLVLLAVLLIPTHAFAYTFSVKVVNKTGGKLWVADYAKIDVKGDSIATVRTHSCGHSTDNKDLSHAGTRSHLREIESNKNTLYTDCDATAQKWQRSVTVQYSCDYPDQDVREVRYPKSKKWYDRDYPSKNGDRYTIVVKEKDC